MISSSERMERLGKRWAQRTEDELPPLDRQRLVDRLESASKPRRHPPRALLFAAAAIMVGVALFALVWPEHQTPFAVDGTEGAVGAWLNTETAAKPLRFEDGTILMVRARSRTSVQRVDDRGAHVVLARGSLRAVVTHRPDTRWRVSAGPFDVRITGTEFDVAWDPVGERFKLSVLHGSVQVKGPTLPEGRQVSAGQQVEVDVGETSRGDGQERDAGHGSPAEADDMVDARGDAHEALPSPGTSAAPARAGWLELEKRGKYEEAMAEAERLGLEGLYGSASAGELLSLARTARVAGRADVAARAWRSCRKRFAGTPQAALAAYSLGRASSGAVAARWFDTYLREAPGGSLAREAAGRKMESHHAAGNGAAAEQAARAYLARYPKGPHAALARGIVGRDGR